MKLHDFLVEHAMFPFPHPNEDRTAGTTDVSQFEVAMLEREWKAGHAVRDDALVQKLCQTLKDILGAIPLAAGADNYLQASFSPKLQRDERGREDEEWDMNPSEAQVSIQTNSRSSLKFIRTDFGTESVVVAQGVPRSHTQVFRRMWSVLL